MSSATTLTGLFNSWLGDIDTNDHKQFPFAVRVGCVKMASPRDERFDIIRELGASLIDTIFNNKPLPSGKLSFVFPERHMSVHEQQNFMRALSSHSSAKDITQVDIITSSPLMIGDFYKEQIRILTWDDDEKYNGSGNN